MIIPLLLISTQATAPASDEIVITASRVPADKVATAASATIVDEERIDHLGEPLVPALLRLTPSVAITTQGGSGLFTEVRIRGAEANHTLLFIDGIRANDPATGDFPRFELLNADLASRIEIVRGPQSALWGSQAIGGVIAINGLAEEPGRSAAAEAGSFGLLRANASAAVGSDDAGLAGAVGWQRAAGVNSFSGAGSAGEKDGYRNLAGRFRGTIRVSPEIELGAAGFALTGRTEFDGFDSATFERADTLDISRNRLAAARLWVSLGSQDSKWSGRLGTSVVGSSNRNFLDNDPLNRTRGTRRTFDAQAEHRFSTGAVHHRLILASDAERETFHARDTAFGGFTNQDRDRSHQALTAEWRGTAMGLTGDVAVRRDIFNRFKDATSLRASALAEIGGGLTLAGSYAEGLAQPTFFDLYGFFPGSFVGNPNLKPESSRGFEASLRFRQSSVAASLTAYRQRLHDEIVDNATFTSVSNSAGVSRRSGVEVELGWQPVESFRLTGNYAYLKASQPNGATNQQLEEHRRPKHSGSIVTDGSFGRWSYGASLAYVGSHLDRQEVFPFAVVRLDSYWLAAARVAYAVTPNIQVFARSSNLFGARYEDSVGYRTEGRGLFVGIRLDSD